MEPISLTAHDVTYEQVAGMIDHSLLNPSLLLDEITAGCDLADRYAVVSVCVRPADVSLAAGRLRDSTVAVGTVVGFPHGTSSTRTKVFEAEQAVADGATELDMVINIGMLKSGRSGYVENEIREIVGVAPGVTLVKVILENAYLTDDEKTLGSKLVEAAGAHYVKTSTGYAPTGATLDDLRLMRASVSPAVRIKAAHGVRSLDALLAVREVGVDRVGATSTAAMLDDYLARTGS
jgi:deoxyribose-phosphate aldolase